MHRAACPFRLSHLNAEVEKLHIPSQATRRSTPSNRMYDSPSEVYGYKTSLSLRISKIYYHVYKSPSQGPIQSQLNPAHILRPHFVRRILVLSSHIRCCILSFVSFHIFWLKCYMDRSSLPFVLHIPPYVTLLCLLSQQKIMFSARYEYPHYVIFSLIKSRICFHLIQRLVFSFCVAWSAMFF